MVEFVSKLEKTHPARELSFPPTPAFGIYRKYFPEEAVAHPTKANTNLLKFLICKFTKEGDVILDPMAGSGSTGVVAALHGRNAILIDIEEKFVEWMLKAKEIVEKHQTLFPKGKIIVLKGDVRELSRIWNRIYDKEEFRSWNIDTIITSPPYTNQAARDLNVAEYRKGGKFAEEKLADIIITSPPFGESNQYRGGTQNKERMMKNRRPGFYSTAKENIGNLPYGDIDSKKLEGGDIEELRKRLMKKNKPTYLSEMLKAYHEMWKVLKPNGRAIIIVKPFIRNKKIEDLPFHTHLLLRRAGFQLEKLYKLRLKIKSFWRILYYRRFPNIPRINHEYILVCRKINGI